MFKIGQILTIEGYKMIRGDRKPSKIKVKIIGLYPSHVLTEKVGIGIKESFGYRELENLRRKNTK